MHPPITYPSQGMKILEVIASVDVGGAERALAARLEHQPEGFETVVLHGPPRTSRQVVFPKKIRCIERSLSRKALRSVIESESPDVVVIHNPLNLVRYPRRTRTTRTPSVVYVAHAAVVAEQAWKARLLLIPFRLSLRKAAKILAVSRQAGTQVGSRRHFEVVHLGSTLSESPLEENQRSNFEWLQSAGVRFLVLSRLSATKNIGGLLNAVSQVQEEFRLSRARLLVVGDGPEKEVLLESVAPLGITDLVRLSPTTTSPTEYLRNTDYLVISSFSEGGPLTAYEAILAGCRLISTPVGAVPDIVELFPDQVIVTQSHHTDALRSGLRAALAGGRPNPSPRQANSSTRVRFSTQSCARDFYAQIMNHSGPDRLS